MTRDPSDLASLLAEIDTLAAQDRMHGLTIWKVQDGYQVNLRTEDKGGFRVMRGATPSEGIAKVLSMDWMDDGHREGSAPVISEPVDFGEAAIADLVTDAIAFEQDAPFEPSAKPSLFD